MNVLLDTCVVIDFLQQREPFADEAKEIFRAAAVEKFVGYTTAKSAADIYYLIHRNTHSDREARDKLNKLLGILTLLDTTAGDIFRALTADTSDFEDAVMIETAVRSHIDCIITRNVKDYRKSSVPAYSPAEFLKQLKSTGRQVSEK